MLILTGFNDVFMIINYVPGLEVCIASMQQCVGRLSSCYIIRDIDILYGGEAPAPTGDPGNVWM